MNFKGESKQRTPIRSRDPFLISIKRRVGFPPSTLCPQIATRLEIKEPVFDLGSRHR
jgi:hypothetical protein